MPAQQEGVMDLYYGYSSGESGWGNQISANFIKIGALMQIAVVSRTTAAPPTSPTNGVTYIVPTGATGAWTGQANKLTVYRSDISGWEFYTPKNGWLAVILGEGSWGTLSVYIGGAWSPGTALA